MKSMKSQEGEKKGKQVFYASANKGVITKVHGSEAFSKAEMDKGYKVYCDSNSLHEMDPDRMHNMEEHTMANRVNPTHMKAGKRTNLHRLEDY